MKDEINFFSLMQEARTLHYILGVSLAMIALFAVASLVMINSQADSISTQTAVNNVNPSVVSKFISSAANGQADAYAGGTINDLVAGGTRTIHVNGIVQDNNGNGDIANVKAVFYRSGVAGGDACVAGDNDCYVVANCTTDTTGVTNLQKRYNCTMNISYYADSTSAGGEFPAENWVVFVEVKDAGDATGTDSSLTKEIQTLLALNIPASINYGALALGASTDAGTNQEMVIAQAGNDAADVEVSAAAPMSCTLGNLGQAAQQWAVADVEWGNGAAVNLSNTPADTNLNVGYRHGANPTKTLYWNIGIPGNNVGGSCTGTSTITAIAG